MHEEDVQFLVILSTWGRNTTKATGQLHGYLRVTVNDLEPSPSVRWSITTTQNERSPL